ncbi:SRPBCC family protein [Nocardia acidivorans]|uniref:SRPBCC family protein n=1 Tax=Nocardia acidivorans TaxID=404580 RepID=UPI00082F80F1|nr:SRPBCC family protein [Nocardia acidivorans]
MLTAVIVAVVVIVVLGALGAGVIALLARGWSRDVLAGKGFRTEPLSSDRIDDYLADKGAFTVTATREFAAPPAKVWDALQLTGTFSWLPLVNGIRYQDQTRREGALRTFDGTFFAVQERVVTLAPHRRMTTTGTRISLPVLVESFAQDHQLTETADGTALAWTIAFRPRIGAFLPLRWAAPFVRPFASYALKGLDTRL